MTDTDKAESIAAPGSCTVTETEIVLLDDACCGLGLYKWRLIDDQNEGEQEKAWTRPSCMWKRWHNCKYSYIQQILHMLTYFISSAVTARSQCAVV